MFFLFIHNTMFCCVIIIVLMILKHSLTQLILDWLKSVHHTDATTNIATLVIIIFVEPWRRVCCLYFSMILLTNRTEIYFLVVLILCLLIRIVLESFRNIYKMVLYLKLQRFFFCCLFLFNNQS